MRKDGDSSALFGYFLAFFLNYLNSYLKCLLCFHKMHLCHIYLLGSQGIFMQSPIHIDSATCTKVE